MGSPHLINYGVPDGSSSDGPQANLLCTSGIDGLFPAQSPLDFEEINLRVRVGRKMGKGANNTTVGSQLATSADGVRSE